MNSKKAIKILQGQIEKLDSYDDPKDETWVFQTAEYIKGIFGENSSQYSYISNFHFGVYSISGESNEVIRNRLLQKQKKVRNFMLGCIETINITGVAKVPKPNFIYRLSDTALWTLITFTITIVFSAGYLLGHYISDIKNIELRRELNQYKEKFEINNYERTDIKSHYFLNDSIEKD